MKITFLGTSHGVPAKDRYCSCTMLEVNGWYYFIDAGAPLIDLLLRRDIDLTRVRAVFTTHIHADHTSGLLHFADLFNWYFKKTDVDIYLTEQQGIDQFRAMIHLLEAMSEDEKLDDDRVRFKLMTADTVYEDENIRVTPFPTQHLKHVNRPVYSYLVEAEGRSVFFSGDLSYHMNGHDFPRYPQEHPVDVMVCEMAHFGVEHIENELPRLQAKQLLFNHVFPLDKLGDIAALDGRFDYSVRAVGDNDEIIL